LGGWDTGQSQCNKHEQIRMKIHGLILCPKNVKCKMGMEEKTDATNTTTKSTVSFLFSFWDLRRFH
ncbi:MAG: hypothetical protein VXB01_15560, partial [Opitutae bacterium]